MSNWQPTDVIMIIGAALVAALILKFAKQIIAAIVKALAFLGGLVAVVILAAVVVWYFDLLPDLTWLDLLNLVMTR